MEITMSVISDVESMSPTKVLHASGREGAVSAARHATPSFVPAVKRVAKAVLTILAFFVIVTAVVALKSWVWIPHSGN
jgi:hypothetical protein